MATDLRNTSIAIIISLFFVSVSPIAIIFGSMLNNLVGILVPLVYVIVGFFMLMIAYVSFRGSGRQSKQRILNRGNLLIMGTAVLTSGISWLIIQSMFYSLAGVFIGFAWLFLL